MKQILFTALFLTLSLTLSAQTVSTWVFPMNVTTNQSLVLAPNQVMEVLSFTVDNTSALDITSEGQTVTFGTGGNPIIPAPLVVAGPATVTFRRPTSGDYGSMITFRVVQIQNPTQSNGQGPRQ